MNFKDGKRDGLCRDWYEDGQLKSERITKMVVEMVYVRDWHENGQLMLEENYKDGKKDGLAQSVVRDGQLSMK